VPSTLSQLLPVLVLIALGAGLGRSGLFGTVVSEGFKRLIASVTLPVLLFTAFSRLRIEGSIFVLAAIIFVSCGALGLVGIAFSRALRLPRPATGLLFQGFEAGMLGYALFASFYGASSVSAFATADLGQAVYVFTVLMAQLMAGETGARVRPGVLARNFATSPVIIAIVAGLAASALVPESRGLPWAAGGFLDATLTLIGSLTSPLVCLVVGFGLREGVRGAGSCLTAVLVRMAVAGALGAVVAFVVVPPLGLGRNYSLAAMVLFLLPPPFVIPVFRTKDGDAAYISGILSIHTVLSLVAIVIFTAVMGGLK